MKQKYREGDEPVPGSGYRLVSFLGQGGFGEVWKASAPGGTEAALKIIHLGGTEGRKEFRALQLVKRIRHTHLVPIYAFWLKNADGEVLDDALVEQPDLPQGEAPPPSLIQTLAVPPSLGRAQASELIIAMGLGDKSFFDRLHECQAEGLSGIPQGELLHYMEDAAEAIDFLNSPLHDLGSGPVAIQHCDIKPQNLMIVGGGAQVCDFGLARMMGADRTTTAAATLAYAAPECLVEGKPSATTDQYSLAVTYFELKTGALPYRNETLAAVMDAKRLGALDFSRLAPAEMAVLHRATSQHPSERYASACAMVAALKQAASTAASSADVTREFTPPAARPKSRKLSAAVVVLLSLAVVGLVIYVTFVRPDGIPLAVRALMQAKSHFDAGEWVEALTDYNEALHKNPTPRQTYLAYLGCGRCYLNLKDWNKALANFELAKKSGGAEPHLELAQAYLARGTEFLKNNQYDQALADLLQARDHNPRDFRIYSRLGAVWFIKQEWQKAIESYYYSIGIDPNDQDLISRGRAYQELKKFDKAEEDFLHAIALNPQNLEAYRRLDRLGGVYLDLKESAKAIAVFDKEIELYGKAGIKGQELALAYFKRGCAYLEIEPESQANDLQAVLDLTLAVSLQPQDADYRDSLEKACQALDRPYLEKYGSRMASALERLKQHSGDTDELNTVGFLLATAPADIRDGKRALAFAARACELSEWKMPEYLDTLAAACAENGQFDEAKKWEKKAIELAPEEADKKRYRTQLERYEAGKPYRPEEPPPGPEGILKSAAG